MANISLLCHDFRNPRSLRANQGLMFHGMVLTRNVVGAMLQIGVYRDRLDLVRGIKAGQWVMSDDSRTLRSSHVTFYTKAEGD